MSIFIDKKSQFEPMPDGANEATISAVKDMGMQPMPQAFLLKNQQQAEKEGRDPSTVPTETRKVVIVYADEKGREASEWLTASLHKNSRLSERVSTILGQTPTQPFDLETLVGTPVTVMTQQKMNGKGYPYASVIAVMKRKVAQALPASNTVAENNAAGQPCCPVDGFEAENPNEINFAETETPEVSAARLEHEREFFRQASVESLG
jgi:hypothetical protein